MRWLVWSATAKSPVDKTAIPVGKLNLARVPTPSPCPIKPPPPATVDTTPNKKTNRMKHTHLSNYIITRITNTNTHTHKENLEGRKLNFQQTEKFHSTHHSFDHTQKQPQGTKNKRQKKR